MNILVDENALWLARSPNIKYLTNLGFPVRAVGEVDCPPLKAPDHVVAKWCRSNDFSILTYDFDDFYRLSENLVILGLVQKGVFRNRPDIIANCLRACLETSGENGRLSSGLYILGNYNW